MSEQEKDGFFTPEKKGVQKGMLGGILMMAIAVIWFVAGYAGGYIFYYPPILFLIGLYAFIKGMITGNVAGKDEDEGTAGLAEGASAEAGGARDYSALFNFERDGFNYYVGGAYFLGSIIMTGIAALLWSPAPSEYYYIGIPRDILEAVLLLAVSYLVRQPIAMVTLFGTGLGLLSLASRYLLVAMQIEGFSIDTVDWWGLLNSFLYGVLFLGGIVAAIRLWGLRMWSLMLGLGIAFLVHTILTTILFSIRFENFSVDWQTWAYDIAAAIIYGALIFAGLQTVLKRKSASRDSPGRPSGPGVRGFPTGS